MSSSQIVADALALLHEALMALRAAEASDAPEEIRAELAAKVTRHLQELAAIKFGDADP